MKTVVNPAIRMLLALYPRPFRERFGPEVAQLLTDNVRDARDRGRFAVLVAAVAGAIDLFRAAGAERWISMTRDEKGALALAIALSAGLGWFDTHTKSDDTGIIAGIVLSAGFVVGALAPRRALWLGLLVGAGIPVMHFGLRAIGILPPQPFEKTIQSLIALIPAVLGAMIGAGLRRAVDHLRAPA